MRWRRQSDREFMRELLLRSQRQEREHREAIRALVVEMRASFHELRVAQRQTTKEITAEIRQFREESRVEHEDHRRALLAILDRLEPGDATA